MNAKLLLDLWARKKINKKVRREREEGRENRQIVT